MISAFAHQINELDRKIDELTALFQGISHGSASLHALGCVQSNVKQNTFRINDLTSKVKDNTEEIKTLKSNDEAVSQEQELQKYQQQSDASQWSPADHDTPAQWSTETQDSQPAWSDLHAPQSPHAPQAPHAPQSPQASQPSWSTPQTPLTPQVPQPASSTQHMQVLNTNCFFTPVDKLGSWAEVASSLSSPSASMDQPADNSQHALLTQLTFYKKRAHQLEIEVKKLESMRRHPPDQRDSWFEHKLKLLKQDKRRRGETIGKLLKCIDDMRDTGRLDASRVTEGRAVLAASLASHGLPLEERIKRTVRAVELDRVPRVRSPVAPSVACDGENQNNSARQSASLSGGSSHEQLVIEAKHVSTEAYGGSSHEQPITDTKHMSTEAYGGSSHEQPITDTKHMSTEAYGGSSHEQPITDTKHMSTEAYGVDDSSSEDEAVVECVTYPLSSPMADTEILQVASDIAHEYGYKFDFTEG